MTDYQTEYLRKDNEALNRRIKELTDKNNIIEQKNVSLQINLNSYKKQLDDSYGMIFAIIFIMTIISIVIFFWSLNSNSNLDFFEINGEIKYEFQRLKEDRNYPDKIIYNKYYIWKDDINYEKNHNCVQEIETHYSPDTIDFINTHYIDKNTTLFIQFEDFEFKYKDNEGYCLKNTYSL